MKGSAGVVATLGILLAVVGSTTAAHSRATPTRARPSIPTDALNDVVKRYCQRCHNDAQRRGNLSLQSFDVGGAPEMADVAEKVVAELRSGMMPPPGSARPASDTLAQLTTTLEKQLDSASAVSPNPGNRSFQRLNRAEYAAAIHDLLSLDIDPGAYL